MHTSVHRSRGLAMGLSGISLALALSLTMVGQAKADTLANDPSHASETIRRLDIMLMVTGLRCRTTADDFQADFQAFEARHLPELNAAARDLVQRYATRMTAEAAGRMLDRLSVQMANRYGNGHPWLGCRELKGLTRALAGQDGRDALLQAAGETLDGDDSLPGNAPVAIASR